MFFILGLINKSSNNAPDGAVLQEQTGNRYKAMDLNDSYDSSYYFEDKNINWTGGGKQLTNILIMYWEKRVH